MIEQQTLTAQSFEDEKTEGKMLLLLDDIDVAKKQLSLLKEESESLSTKLKDLEFHLDELNLERDSLSVAPEPLSQTGSTKSPNQESSNNYSENAESKFFPYLNSLENRLTESEGRLEGHRQLTSELNHQLNKLNQTNKKLKAEFEQILSQSNQEDDAFRVSTDTLEDLEMQLDEKTKENEFLLQKCDALKTELEERTEQIQNSLLAHHDELRKVYQEKEKTLTSLRKRSSELRGDSARLEKRLQEELKAHRENHEKNSQVNSWKSERGILKTKLKNLKTQLLTEQGNLESSQKRDQELDQKYVNLLGEDHNHGECELARKCIIASIKDSNEAKDDPSFAREMEYERDYTEQLNEEMKKIENSLRVFREYREAQLISLNEELNGCAQKGYIKLLKEEFAELQMTLTQLQ
ncbi:hypothetical protein TRFO_02285 [Tritrichomonas foetus]|uniref:Uncharacterized protein n=1 Tax=Tritrichomonas foetus TaxID=1144522 RepID=A0A1J4JDC5_9EUKA|nr:hypothetical protein TRFO_02285 [Tritrichomonas foetus]|eukprot:OHS95276.1 hypothetical protein TRFO_02285 [Tritrichomonas foetus]